MTRLINLPTKGSEEDGIVCVYTEERGYRVQDSKGSTIVEIDAMTSSGKADQIASAIRQARDAGFQQGLAHVRHALGIVR
jgi:hypothetical protein